MSIELTFPEDYSREELINGEVVLMAPALPPHVRISGNIFGSFLNYLKDKKCAPIADGVTVFLSDTEHYVPDFMVVCDPDKIKRDGVHGAPDLVVEVLSKSTAKRDRWYKKRGYESGWWTLSTGLSRSTSSRRGGMCWMTYTPSSRRTTWTT